MTTKTKQPPVLQTTRMPIARLVQFTLILAIGFAVVSAILVRSSVTAEENGAKVVKKGDSANTSAPASQLMPLTETTQWDYRARFSIPLIRNGKARAKMYVDGVKEVNGKKYYRLITEVNAGIIFRQRVVSHHRHDSTGMYQLTEDEKEETLFLPSPLVVGKKWKASIPDNELEGEVIAQETIRSGGVEYKDCFKVVLKSDKMERTQWLAPGVGVVKTSDRYPHLSVESELVKHRE